MATKSKYVIVRTYSAGVFAGTFVKRTGQEVILKDVRRLWYWKGAMSLSELAVNGTTDPNSCKFGVPVSQIEVLQAIEILDVTKQGEASIKGVQIWKQ